MLFFAASVYFLPMTNITNGITYNASQFWNSSIAIVAASALARSPWSLYLPCPHRPGRGGCSR
jgi:hypothetical protein